MTKERAQINGMMGVAIGVADVTLGQERADGIGFARALRE